MCSVCDKNNEADRNALIYREISPIKRENQNQCLRPCGKLISMVVMCYGGNVRQQLGHHRELSCFNSVHIIITLLHFRARD